MAYEWNERNQKLSHTVLSLLTNIYNESEALPYCWKIIETAACVQTEEDVMIAGTMKRNYSEDAQTAIDLKSDVLLTFKINNLKVFDYDLLREDVKNLAARGVIHACKLWAYMNWTCPEQPEDRQVALRYWELLAIHGDDAAMMALSFAYRSLGDVEHARLWENTLRLCESNKAFLQPLMMLRDACEDKHALELTEIVMCIRSRTATKEQSFIDPYMAQYALYSKDSIATKLQKLAVESNFYLVLFNERMSTQKNIIGFAQAM
jgi:TPR repeat protein